MTKTGIIDYGSGNIFSLVNALNHIGVTNRLISSVDELQATDQIIVPGVGSFSACMNSLQSAGFVEALKPYVKSGKKVLGICVGMQILFDKSSEFGEHAGFGVFSGNIERISSTRKDGRSVIVPHVGWKKLLLNQFANFSAGTSQIFDEIDSDQEYYFVHSYSAKPLDQNELVAVACYEDQKISAAVGRGNILGLQFHPEKSGEAGLTLLKKWANF